MSRHHRACPVISIVKAQHVPNRYGGVCRTFLNGPATAIEIAGTSPAMTSSVEWRSLPERRPRLFEPAAEAHGGDAPREAGSVVSLERERAQRRRSHRRLELGSGDAAQEPRQRLLLGHADAGIVIAGHADIGHEAGAAAEH